MVMLKKRKPDTVYDWLSRFPYKGSFKNLAEAENLRLLRSPKKRQRQKSKHCACRQISGHASFKGAVVLANIPGVHNILSDLGISYKRGRTYISPDGAYKEKMLYVSQVLEQAKQNPDTYVALYQDEFAFYRRPTLAKDWTERGTKKPLAHQGLGCAN